MAFPDGKDNMKVYLVGYYTALGGVYVDVVCSSREKAEKFIKSQNNCIRYVIVEKTLDMNTIRVTQEVPI